MLELWHATHSTCSQKVRICLAEKRLPWRSHFVDLRPLRGSADLEWGFQTPTLFGVWYQHIGGHTYVFADVDGVSIVSGGVPVLQDLAVKINGIHHLSVSDFLGVKNKAPVTAADGDGARVAAVLAQHVMPDCSRAVVADGAGGEVGD